MLRATIRPLKTVLLPPHIVLYYSIWIRSRCRVPNFLRLLSPVLRLSMTSPQARHHHGNLRARSDITKGQLHPLFQSNLRPSRLSNSTPFSHIQLSSCAQSSSSKPHRTIKNARVCNLYHPHDPHATLTNPSDENPAQNNTLGERRAPRPLRSTRPTEVSTASSPRTRMIAQ